jgi:hypothetical protein
MAGPTTTIKLQVNIPLIGTVKFLDYYPEKPNPNEPGKMMSAQWGFKGTWDGIGEGRVYADEYQLPTGPLMLGLAEQQGEERGLPRYRWKYDGKVQIVKREEGRKRVIYLSRLSETTPQSGRMHTNAQNQNAPSPLLPVSTTQVWKEMASDAMMQPKPVMDEWAALEARYARCVEIARRSWETLGKFGDTALVAATATLFIEANKEHLQTPSVAAPLTAPAPQTPSAIPSEPPSDQQIAQFRALLASDDPYGGGPVFTPEERQTWLMTLGQATAHTLAEAMGRLQKILAQRTVRSQAPQAPRAPQAAGPGMPGAYEPGDLADDLPF